MEIILKEDVANLGYADEIACQSVGFRRDHRQAGVPRTACQTTERSLLLRIYLYFGRHL